MVTELDRWHLSDRLTRRLASHFSATHSGFFFAALISLTPPRLCQRPPPPGNGFFLNHEPSTTHMVHRPIYVASLSCFFSESLTAKAPIGDRKAYSARQLLPLIFVKISCVSTFVDRVELRLHRKHGSIADRTSVLLSLLPCSPYGKL